MRVLVTGATGSIAVGRDFPPMEKTWARISLGRMEDMEKDVPVLRKALGKA